MRHILITTTLSIAASLGFAPAAVAEPQATFRGNCTLTGTVSFVPAARLLPQPGSSSAALSGKCTGTLTEGAVSRSMNSAQSTYVASASSAAMGCGGGISSGSGRLTVNGVPVEFTLREIRVAPIAQVTLRGGAAMLGIVNVDPAASLDVVKACSGAGLARVPVSGRFVPL